jgi:hypothetical protein
MTASHRHARFDLSHEALGKFQRLFVMVISLS